MKCAITPYGFEWGPATITRAASCEKKGQVVLLIETKKYFGNKALKLYVTKSGKVRIFDNNGEWIEEKKRGES